MFKQQTLLIGKNSFVGKSIKKIANNNFKFISHIDIDRTDFSKYSNVVLCSHPQKYFKKREKYFEFEKKIFKNIKNQKLIFLSSSKVYPNKLNCNEKSETFPQNYYGENKLKVEQLIKENVQNYLLLRVSNLISINSFKKNSFFDILLQNAKMNSINFDYSLNSKKDFISIDVFFKILDSLIKKPLKNDIFNVGCGRNGFKVMNVIKLFLGKKFKDINSFKIKEIKKSQTLSLSKLSSKIRISEKKNSIKIITNIKKCGKFYF